MAEESAPLGTWVVLDPADPLLAPVYDQPPCPGPTFHEWSLTIEEGRMALSSGCQECDDVVLTPMGGEDVEMATVIKGRLTSHLETYGWETPEYDHWWEFVPSQTGSSRAGDRG